MTATGATKAKRSRNITQGLAYVRQNALAYITGRSTNGKRFADAPAGEARRDQALQRALDEIERLRRETDAAGKAMAAQMHAANMAAIEAVCGDAV